MAKQASAAAKPTAKSSTSKDAAEGQSENNRGRQQTAVAQPKASLNLAELRELAELVEQYGFTDFEFENENIRVRLSKQSAPQYISAPTLSPVTPQTQLTASPQAVASAAPTGASASTGTIENTGVNAVGEEAGLQQITSPIVGTFYRSPSPEAEPFVKIGSQVTPEAVVCIVEAMKLMNEIQAEMSGEVVKIYVENGQPVEYGQPLFGVKK